MSPWWLRPAADDKPKEKGARQGERSDRSPKRASEKGNGGGQKAPPGTKTKQETKGPERDQPRSGKGRGGRRRGGKQKAPRAPQLLVAVLVELDLLARALAERRGESFSPAKFLENLSDLGRIGPIRVYGDRERHRELLESCRDAGCEVVAPKQAQGDDRALGLMLAMDALEIALSKDPVDAVVLVTDRQDLWPLVGKLRAVEKKVIGVTMPSAEGPSATAGFDSLLDLKELLAASSKEAARVRTEPEPEAAAAAVSPAVTDPVFKMLAETVRSLDRGGNGVLWGSLLKREMHRRNPGFDEATHGYQSFSELLEDADRHGVIELEIDDRSGKYYVAGLVGE